MERTDPELGARTWTELADAATPPLLLVPIGATEQHGPHLPLTTDTIVAEALARSAAERIGATAERIGATAERIGTERIGTERHVLVAPTLTITASGEHQGFPGTLSIGTAAMTAVVVELVRSADWAGGVVLVNGHGGNLAAVTDAVALLTTEGRRVHAWWPYVPGGDPHAGHVETSLILALAPELVRVDRAEAGPVPSMADLHADGLAVHSATGVLGDPTAADAGAGAALLATLVDDLVSTVQGLLGRWHVDARS